MDCDLPLRFEEERGGAECGVRRAESVVEGGGEMAIWHERGCGDEGVRWGSFERVVCISCTYRHRCRHRRTWEGMAGSTGGEMGCQELSLNAWRQGPPPTRRDTDEREAERWGGA